jgi:hypothetical protein
MKKLYKPLFTDRRKKPITVKGTKLKAPKKLLSNISSVDMSSDTPAADMAAPVFNKGGIVSRGQGKIMKSKTTQYC